MSIYTGLMTCLGVYVAGKSGQIFSNGTFPSFRGYETGFSRLAQYTAGGVAGHLVGEIALKFFRTVTPFSYTTGLSQILLFGTTLLLLPKVTKVEEMFRNIGLLPGAH